MKDYLVFDWGGTQIKYALMNENAEIIKRGSYETPAKSAGYDRFAQLLDEAVLPHKDSICGLAISSPGIIDADNGIIVTVSVFPYLNGICINDELTRRYQLPVAVENDGKCAALAEYWRGNLSGVKDGAVLVIGTGIGGGIILDSNLRRGKKFCAGEFSCLCLNYDDPSRKGSYGGQQLGWKGLAELVNEAYGVTGDLPDGYEMFARINAGEEKALKALRRYTDRLAVYIFNLNILLDLEKILIGGGISGQEALLISLQKSLDEFAKINPDLREGTVLPMPKVGVCRYGNDANLIGALYHFLRSGNFSLSF